MRESKSDSCPGNVEFILISRAIVPDVALPEKLVATARLNTSLPNAAQQITGN